MKRATFIISVIGLFFAGYLVLLGALTGNCAFQTPCQYFIGIPAYSVGCALFFTVLAMFALLRWRMVSIRLFGVSVLVISLAGTIFSGYFAALLLPSVTTAPAMSFFLFAAMLAIGLVDWISINKEP